MPRTLPILLAQAIACGAPFLIGGTPAAHTSPEA